MHDSAAGDPVLTMDRPKSREGIVVSTVLRLTTSDGQRFEDVAKAMEHEVFYQVLRRLVKELSWPDNEETATFATKLSKHFSNLLPLLNKLETDAEALRAHLATYRNTPHE